MSITHCHHTLYFEVVQIDYVFGSTCHAAKIYLKTKPYIPSKTPHKEQAGKVNCTQTLPLLLKSCRKVISVETHSSKEKKSSSKTISVNINYRNGQQ